MLGMQYEMLRMLVVAYQPRSSTYTSVLCFESCIVPHNLRRRDDGENVFTSVSLIFGSEVYGHLK
jgi:hypothetical protein